MKSRKGYEGSTSAKGIERVRRATKATAFAGFLLPLDRRRWLRAQVERDPVHAWNLVDHPTRDRLQQVVGQTRPIRRHRVLGGDCPDDDRVCVRPLIALHADRTNRRQHGERLPELAVQAGPGGPPHPDLPPRPPEPPPPRPRLP